MDTNLRSLINGIKTRDELNEVIEIIKEKSNQLKRVAMAGFFKGDKVRFFSSKRGKIITGTVTKINSTTIAVNAGDDGTWRVSAGLLTKIH